jgi:hypothetical protein
LEKNLDREDLAVIQKVCPVLENVGVITQRTVEKLKGRTKYF